MIKTIKQQDDEILRIYKEQLGLDGLDSAELHCIRLFAKWYAEYIIDKCAEEATIDEVGLDYTDEGNIEHGSISIDKQSILKLKEDL